MHADVFVNAARRAVPSRQGVGSLNCRSTSSRKYSGCSMRYLRIRPAEVWSDSPVDIGFRTNEANRRAGGMGKVCVRKYAPCAPTHGCVPKPAHAGNFECARTGGG